MNPSPARLLYLLNPLLVVWRVSEARHLLIPFIHNPGVLPAKSKPGLPAGWAQQRLPVIWSGAQSQAPSPGFSFNGELPPTTWMPVYPTRPISDVSCSLCPHAWSTRSHKLANIGRFIFLQQDCCGYCNAAYSTESCWPPAPVEAIMMTCLPPTRCWTWQTKPGHTTQIFSWTKKMSLLHCLLHWWSWKTTPPISGYLKMVPAGRGWSLP